MKISILLGLAASAAIAAVVACSSSSSGSGFPTCKNPPATGSSSTACTNCVESHCGSQVSTAESACSAFLSCYEACNCSDDACIAACAGKQTTACTNAGTAENSCQAANCTSACSTPVPDAGTPGADSGTPGSDGGALSANCQTYVTCCAEAVAGDAGTVTPQETQACTQAAASLSDSTCAAAVSAYQSMGFCK